MHFIIPGPPKGKGRPRFGNGHTYTPQNTVDYETLVKQSFCLATQGRTRPAKGAVVLYIDVYHAIPASTPKSQVTALLDKHPLKKPDIDNVIKVVMDSLNGLAYEDDKQVIGIVAGKFYAREGRVEVRIEEVKGVK